MGEIGVYRVLGSASVGLRGFEKLGAFVCESLIVRGIASSRLYLGHHTLNPKPPKPKP